MKYSATLVRTLLVCAHDGKSVPQIEWLARVTIETEKPLPNYNQSSYVLEGDWIIANLQAAPDAMAEMGDSDDD